MTQSLSIHQKNAIRALLRQNDINPRGLNDEQLLAQQASLQGEEITITELPTIEPRKVSPIIKKEPEVKATKDEDVDAEVSAVPHSAVPHSEDSEQDITRAEYHRTLLNTMKINNRIMERLLDDMDKADSEGEK